MILYKMILDFYEATYATKIDDLALSYKKLMPSCQKFYQQLSDQEIAKLLEQVQDISTQMMLDPESKCEKRSADDPRCKNPEFKALFRDIKMPNEEQLKLFGKISMPDKKKQ